MKVISETRRAQ